MWDIFSRWPFSGIHHRACWTSIWVGNHLTGYNIYIICGILWIYIYIINIYIIWLLLIDINVYIYIITHIIHVIPCSPFFSGTQYVSNWSTIQFMITKDMELNLTERPACSCRAKWIQWVPRPTQQCTRRLMPEASRKQLEKCRAPHRLGLYLGVFSESGMKWNEN